MSELLTGVFAKRPEPGRVKTRLAPVLGQEGAAAFARALLDDAVARLCGEATDGQSGELVFAPAQDRAWFEAAYPGIALRAQVGEGLAERLASWFDAVLVEPGRFAAAVGSDSPWTSRAHVARAAAALEHGADVVLGPDLGGGYYLVALARPVPGLFTEIEMSTRSMFAETCALVRSRGLELALLEPDYDVDERVDWERLLADLAGGRASGPEAPAAVAAFARAWLADGA